MAEEHDENETTEESEAAEESEETEEESVDAEASDSDEEDADSDDDAAEAAADDEDKPKRPKKLPVTTDYVEDLLHELAEIADETGLDSIEAEVVNDRIPALRDGRITVVVLGEFNHGKSTVVNALLGEDVLPVGITPTTAVITHLVHGDRKKITVKPPNDGEEYTIKMSELEDVVTHEEGTEGSEPEYIEIQHPNAFLGDGLVLVDTPGVNDISRQKVEITYGYLPRADVILYVLDATQVLKKSEVTFIKDRLLKANRDRIVFVLGKVDALSEEDAKEVELYARERLEGLIGPVELFAFSARNALEARKKGEEAPEEFEKFHNHLTQYLNDQRSMIILQSAVGGGLRITSLLSQNLSIKKQGYLLASDELEKRITAVQGKLNESRALIAQNLDKIDDSVGGIAATARHNLRQFVNGFAEALPQEIEKADAKDVKRYLPTFIQDQFKDFIEREGYVIAGNLEELAEEIIEITNESLKDTMTSVRDELGLQGELNLEVDTIAYDASVFALGVAGFAMLFANVLVGGLLTIAAPLLAFFLKDRVDTKIKERAREEGVRAIRSAGEEIEQELLRVIHNYGDQLKEFVETAGDRLYRQIEEVLEQVQKERSENTDQEALLQEVEKRLAATNRVRKMLEKGREQLTQYSVGALGDD